MTIYRAARRAAVFVALATVTVAAACTRDVVVGENKLTVASAMPSGLPGIGGAGACLQARCQNHYYECGDCIDNDADGVTDMDDPDCLGPCHNSESLFFGNIPGQNNGNCVQDCYFDQDSGGGNDDCVWSHECDRQSVAPDYPPQGPACAYDPTANIPGNGGPSDCASLEQAQSALCLSICGPLTPNGCDCFGCCEVPGAQTPIWMGSVDSAGKGTCDLAHVGDPTRCRPCTQVAACLNTCETCELCVGKRSLPASCGDGSSCAVPLCPGSLNPCGTPCLPACRTGEICITGCCAKEPR